jgi:hypothetical protein
VALELPPIDDREAWFDRLGDPEAELVGAALAEAAPAWMAGALAWQLDRAATADQVRPWLTALALAPAPILDESADAVIWGRVASWAHDPSISTQSRCISTMALGRAAGTRHADQVSAELRRLAAAHQADVRGCAALALARFGEDPLLEALLADPSPRVRAATALALRIIRKPAAPLRSRLSLQADRDSEMRARTSAALSLKSRDPNAAFVLLRARPSSALGLAGPDHWERFVFGQLEVDVPMLGSSRGWAIVPLSGAVPAVVDTGAVLIPVNSYGPYDYYHM